MLAPSPSLPSVAELRARIATTAVSTRPGLPFGIADLDRHLAGGGVATDGVHEVAGASPGLSDDAAATLFVAGLAARFASKCDNGHARRSRAAGRGGDPRHYRHPVVREIDGARQLGVMTWGFPPPPGVKPLVVNVRNYTSPFWRTALSKPDRRCLVPVTEFQEWSVEPDPATGKKSKHWFAVPSRPIFAFAGVWRPVGEGASYAFLTCGYDGDPAGHVVGAIHPNAMPVILHEEDFGRWLQARLRMLCRWHARFPRSFYLSGRSEPDRSVPWRPKRAA